MIVEVEGKTVKLSVDAFKLLTFLGKEGASVELEKNGKNYCCAMELSDR